MKSLVRLLAVLVCLAAGSARAAEEMHKLDKVLGNPNAPITIIEYASTTCPHCAAFYKSTMPKIKAEWIDTGKAKLIYRDFPTGPKHLSVGASMIAHCSGPERYYPMLGLLFENQDRWLTAQNPLAVLKSLAKLGGMGEDKVDACLKDQGLANAIEERAIEGNRKYGIDGTPSFVINGKVIPGAVPYEEFDKALKAASR